jgi:hypothetical protein
MLGQEKYVWLQLLPFFGTLDPLHAGHSKEGWCAESKPATHRQDMDKELRQYWSDQLLQLSACKTPRQQVLAELATKYGLASKYSPLCQKSKVSRRLES